MGLADEIQQLADLRHQGTLTDAEFEQAKAALLAGLTSPAQQPLGDHLSEQMSEVRHENKLARIDREWEIDRRQYLITDKHGHQLVPTSLMGIGSAVLGGIFGVIWTSIAISITSGAPDFGPFAIAKVAFPLFGVVFTVFAIGWGLRCHSRAQQYDAAFRAYQARRNELAPDRLHM
jgi:hypothetical protein